MIFAKRGWRPSRIFVAGVLLFATILPLLNVPEAEAAILGNREIKISSSAASATNTTYHVEFDIGTTNNVQGIIVEFCAETPVIGDTTCSTPTGFSITATPAVSGQSDGTGLTANLSTFTTANDLGSNSRTLILTAASAVSLDAADTAFFDLTTVTNPSTVGTFYARIYTYATSAAANAYTIASPGTYVDAGGIALSTAAQITVTAKVAERIVFCVYTVGDGDDCATNTGTAVALGDTNGVLDPLGPYVSAFEAQAGANDDTGTRFSITTNASGSATVRLKGTTLTSGSNTITPNTTAAASNAGNEQFGLCIDVNGAAGLTIDTLYDGDPNDDDFAECQATTNTAGTGSTGGAGTAVFAFDNNGTTGTGSLYGDTIATKTAGDYSTGRVSFIGNIGNATEAGIYTTILTFIATGTY